MSWNFNLGSLNWFNSSSPPAPKKRRRPNGKKSPTKPKGGKWGFRIGKNNKRKLTALEKLARITQVDQELSQEAPKRWRPAITPKHKKFQSQLDSFDRMFTESENMSLQKILNTIFAPEERQLLVPINPERNPPLARIQESNTRQFEELLRSEAFGDLAYHENPTAVKLTLAYFGIPTAPIEPVEGIGWVDDADISDQEEDLPLFPPRVRNLQFANKYARRLYAFDHSRRPDPFLETYNAMDPYFAPHPDSIVPEYGPGLTLRGGSGDETSLSLRGGGDDDGALSLRGGAKGDKNDYYSHKNYTTTLDGDPRDKDYTNWMTLYGYQGQVAFEPSSLNTFVDAVDRLLDLDCRAGVMYKLYMRDRRTSLTKGGSWTCLPVTCKGVGNFEADQTALDWINKELKNYTTEEDEVGEHMVLFVTGPTSPAPSYWQPRAQDRVLKFELVWPDNPSLYRRDIAYLRIPQNLRTVKHTNQYARSMARICRLLTAGQIPYRPGRPNIPNAHFSIQGFAPGGVHVGSYGGLAWLPQLWAKIVKSWKTDPQKSVVLSAKTSTKGLGDRIFLFLPGNSQPYSIRDYIPLKHVSRREYVESTILDLVKQSMSDESYEELMGVEITIPGDLVFLSSPGEARLFLPVGGNEDQDEKGPIVRSLMAWLEFLDSKKIVAPAENGFQMYPLFLTLQPRFREYRAHNAMRLDDEPISWRPNNVSLSSFRSWVKHFLGVKNVSADSLYIEYRQAPKPPKGQRERHAKPRFLIGPATTEREWADIRSMIVEPDGYIAQVDQSAMPIFGDQRFGEFEIYNTPAKQLYVGLDKENQPGHKRYYDYQMRGENASIKLPTRQPGGVAHEKVPVDRKGRPITDKPTQTKIEKFKVTQPGHSLDFLNDPSFTSLQKALQLREYSYFHPLDIHINNSIPINAPPLENIIDIGKDSTPKLSLGVLTPSEVRRLKKDYFNLRNILLDRTQVCPYAGCNQTYGVTQVLELQQHLNESHGTKEKCPFCDDLLFPFWSKSQRGLHIAQAHPNIIPGLHDQEQDEDEDEDVTVTETQPSTQPTTTTTTIQPISPTAGSETTIAVTPTPTPTPTPKPLPKFPDPPPNPEEIPIPSTFDPISTNPGLTPKGESHWIYCVRCGRDHTLLNQPLDRTHHDKICQFGLLTSQYQPPNGPGDWEICTTCGAYIPKTAGGHHAHHKPEPYIDAPYCYTCGIGLGGFSKEYGDLHMGHCKGYGSGRLGDFKYCCWCRGVFGDLGKENEGEKAVEWLGHVRRCEARPEEGNGGSGLEESETWLWAVGVEEQLGKEGGGGDKAGEEEDKEETEKETGGAKGKSVSSKGKAVKSTAAKSTATKKSTVAKSTTAKGKAAEDTGYSTRSKTGAKTSTTWKAKEGASLPATSKKSPTKKKPTTGATGTAYPDQMDVDETGPGPVVGTPKKVAFSDAVQVKEIEPIKNKKANWELGDMTSPPLKKLKIVHK